MILFKFLWIVDAIAALVILYFFFVGLGDNTVGARNIWAWFILIAALAGILPGSIWLSNHQHGAVAFTLLLILAIPALFYLMYILVAVFGNQRFN